MIQYEDLKVSNASFLNEIELEVSKTIRSGWYLLGNQLREFETEFSEYCGMTHCIGVGSGLDALVLGLKALNLPKGSEVIVAGNVYIACIIAIQNAGLVPKLVDPDEDSCNLTAEGVSRAMGPKVKAVMPVHMYGRACNMVDILAFAKSNGLHIIEDCAQAHGAYSGESKVGSLCDIAAYSFYPTKNLGCFGDGGAVCLNDESMADRIRKLRNYGFSRKYFAEEFGVNSRLDEVQATILRIKLRWLDQINSHKRKLAAIYDEFLPKQVIKPLPEIDEKSHVYHIYNIRVKEREKLRYYLLQNGVTAEIHYPIPPHLQPCSQGKFKGLHLPVSEKIHEETLSLPISYGHKEKDIHTVCEVITQFFELDNNTLDC
jgi:dTDP-4-amino-4,6-dideoxygalactose transaminase